VASSLAERDRAFAHELAYGVTRLRGRLDHLLSVHVPRGLEGVEPAIREVLRLGTYQLFYMGGVPIYAAVAESVEQARKVGGSRVAGFVNAVLRRVAETGDGNACFPGEASEPAAFLSSWGSHPRWLVDRWLECWSPSEVRRLVDIDNRRPSVFLVPLDSTAEDAVKRLADAGIGATVVGCGTGCIRLDDGVSVGNAINVAGPAIAQDPAANLVSVYADVPSGTIVADLCAAPGGKALALTASDLTIFAADRSETRIRLLRDNAQRTGRRAAVAVADATRPPLRAADVVLLDVPCTGTGTLARHPDARWRLRPDSIEAMTVVQDRMLQAAADVVAPGGLLIYSTCSLEPEENGLRVGAFLESRPEFTIEPSTVLSPDLLDVDGCLSVTPQAHGFDGSYAARMRRGS
jgi:16S rRNA (cytosine967-C5)-methyltransferase